MKLSTILSSLLLGSTLLLTGCGSDSDGAPVQPQDNDGGGGAQVDDGGEAGQPALSTEALQGITFYKLNEDKDAIENTIDFSSNIITIIGEDTVVANYIITPDGYVAFDSPWEADTTEYIGLSSIDGDTWNMCFANDGDADFENSLATCSEPGRLFSTEAAAQAAADENQNDNPPLQELTGTLAVLTPADLKGYRLTSVEADSGFDKQTITIEFFCDGQFKYDWTHVSEGLSPNTKTITGDEIFFKRVTGWAAEAVPRIRWSGIDKFGQSGNDGNIYLVTENDELKVNQSCFNSYDCSGGFYLESITQVDSCN